MCCTEQQYRAECKQYQGMLRPWACKAINLPELQLLSKPASKLIHQSELVKLTEGQNWLKKSYTIPFLPPHDARQHRKHNSKPQLAGRNQVSDAHILHCKERWSVLAETQTDRTKVQRDLPAAGYDQQSLLY